MGSPSPLGGVVKGQEAGEPRTVEGAAGADVSRIRYVIGAEGFLPGAATDLPPDNLSKPTIPLPLPSAHLPDRYRRPRAGRLQATPGHLVVDRVHDVPGHDDRARGVNDEEYV